MITYLKITDGLKRSLGYLDEDDSLDDGLKNKMSNALIVAESYVQHAIGTDVKDFYISEENKPLYTLVCNALAASYVQNPVSITSGAIVNVDIVTNAIIGQLRGRYAKELEDQDGQNTKSQSSDSEN
ncbi:DNA packaging protein [Lactobacillus gasseri]|uniref:DNA packaging protein n=1 Tax=Lactobacillus gasseri TaxID=1596 RepID=A0ABY3BC23_LACGS|nr:DNA packaging protein [Lactobacillus gasseri]MCZ3932521.1 DNA packaging protein [Lactobacillus gasseri]MCZ3934155.1 DNA packaging protein [Lactobacillus gasseri]MCZ3936133.1 DNA packaging protein [Lactobacillus gasseri]MCZ3943504.1 DNA packaging protein [Lactobacillus gasseri]MCZ3949062.1 DNA packaging protein [Lactobacillus gasseri]